MRGRLSSNDGESALGWALDGHGIVLRSAWEAAPHLASGRLRAVLPDWRLPSADIHAVFATRSHLAAKTRALIDFLVETFAPHRQADQWMVAGQVSPQPSRPASSDSPLRCPEPPTASPTP